MKKLKRKILGVVSTVSVLLFNGVNAFATNADIDAPTFPEVWSIVEDGLDLFFGALGAFAVIMGGMEFYKAFISFKDSRAKGGYGASKSDLTFHVIAGVLCLIGAIVIFVVHDWTIDLFSI